MTKSEWPRVYYPLDLAAKKMNCSTEDILHLGATNRLEICAYIKGVELSPDGFNFNVTFDEDDEYVLNEITENKCIISDLYQIILFEYNDNTIISEVDLKPRGWYANDLNGFFAMCSNDLVDIELSGGLTSFEVNISELSTPNIDDRKPIEITNINDLVITENMLVVMGKEIENFNASVAPSIRGKIDAPKTEAKKAELIYCLLKMIPELSGVDLDNTPITKITSMIEEVAAKKGVALPSTHWQTWKRYLRR